MALYNADGQINLTVVDGSTYTGAQAADGSYYIVLNDGTSYTGVQHRCGAMNAVINETTMAASAPNGSIYVRTQTDGVGYTPNASPRGTSTSTAWVKGGAVIDLDFLNGRYYGGTPSTLLANTNSTGGFSSLDSASITTIAANLLRYQTGGLLSEPGVTNVETYGSDFTNATWNKNGIGTGVAPTVTANFAAAPDGTLTANRVQFNLGATPSTAYSRIYGTNTAASNGASPVWLKSNDSNSYILYLVAAAGIRPTILVTPTWQRFNKPINTPLNVEFGLTGTVGTDTTADILVWGAQLEVSASGRPTSTISTVASTVARSADSLSFAGAAVAAAAAGKSSIRYIDSTTGLLTATNFNAGAFSFPSNGVIQRITIYDAVTTPATGVNATVSFNGNSLFSGTNATSSQSFVPQQVLVSLAKLGYSIALHNYGVGGQTTSQMNVVASNNSDLIIPGSASPYIDIAWELTNDIILNGVSGATAYANLVTYAQARRAAIASAGVSGAKLAVLTCIPRATTAAGWTAGMETARLAANALILADTTHWDLVIDVASLSQFANPTSMLNKAYVNQTDGTHLTDLGYQLIRDKILTDIQAVLPTL